MKHFKLLSLLLMATFGVLAFTACGDDDSGDKDKGNGNITPEQLIGSWSSVAFTPEGQSRIALNSSNEDHWRYCLRFELTKDEITQYAINYNGSEGYRGRWEKTLIGKYRIDGNAFIIYNYYEGYHNVIDYENGRGTMQAGPMQATISLSNSIFYVTIAGKGTYELKKGDVAVSPQASILGTWGTKEIEGSASDPNTKQVIENWDNFPSINDAETGKESLKYMEFTFGENSYFKLQQFDDQIRTFTAIMEGTWNQKGNTLSVDFGGGNGKTVELVSLTQNQLVIHMNYIDDEFRVKKTGEKRTVIYDETIYFSRVK